MEQTADQMRARIAEATRAVCERQGAAAATVTAIAREAGIKRELFYYYVSGRDEAIQLMLDALVEECVDSVRLWAESLDSREEGFSFFAPLFRRVFYDNAGQRRSIHRVLMDLGKFGYVKTRTVEEVVSFLQTTSFYANYAQRSAARPDLMMTFAMYGCFGLLQVHPEMTDAELAAVCAQALGVDEACV